MSTSGFRSITPGRAKQVSRTGTFELPCNADIAFPLFSPEGERKWVVGWDPRPIFPDQIVFEPNTVFRQGQGAEEAVWTILEADWQRHRAEYVRVDPSSHAARIIVAVEPLSRSRCHVVVSYTVTVFGDNTAAQLESFSENAYAEKMGNWRRQIASYLESRTAG